MDPVSLTLGVVGLGMSLFGGIGQANSARQTATLEQQKAGVSENTAGLEIGQNDLRQQMMNMSARRSQLENLRNTQRARAYATQAGVSQGAQYGSGVAGGVASAQDQGGYGALGISQNQQAGNSMFTSDRQIDLNKIQMAQIGGQEAQVQGNAATDAGIASLGGSLLKAAPMLGNMSKGFGGFSFNGLFGGGSPSGYGTGN